MSVMIDPAVSQVESSDHLSNSSMSETRVLVVDDDVGMLRAVKAIMCRDGYRVFTASSASDALAILPEAKIDVVLLDIQMPTMSGLELLPLIRSGFERVQVIMMTAYATVNTAVGAVKDGAFNFITKPFDSVEQLSAMVKKAVEHKAILDRNRYLERSLDTRDRYEDMVGRSVRMREVFELVESISYSCTNVLIQGESGTGKELVARATHFRSPRAKKPFVVINCSALSETLLESELFGHVKGAFTGASANKKGLFEVAHGGTIFLDEIGDITPMMQVKLLRVLQEGEIKRVGSHEVIRVDVRTIAATNVNLELAIKNGHFREDLYYRLNVISIDLPPLRARVEDIPLLAHHMLRRLSAKLGQHIDGFEPEVMSALQQYRWSGNVRELENVIERAVVLCRDKRIGIRHLPPRLRGGGEARDQNDGLDYAKLPFGTAKKLALRAFERRYLTSVLARTEGNISRASREAGLDRSNFRRVLKKHDIDLGEHSA